jgi:hypothetical protein
MKMNKHPPPTWNVSMEMNEPPTPPTPPATLTPQAPQAEAASIINRRFPKPRFTDCDQNGSQARFLLAKLNPSATYNSAGGGMSSEVIMTDDVSLQVGGAGEAWGWGWGWVAVGVGWGSVGGNAGAYAWRG